MNSHAIERGNRHFHRDLMERMEARPGIAGMVRIRIAADLAATLAGQHLIWMLTSLLARQFGIVNEIELHVPDVAPLRQAMLMPSGFIGSSLRETLQTMVEQIAPGQIRVDHAPQPERRAVVQYCIGDVAPLAADHTYYLYADGWKATIKNNAAVPSFLPASSASIGPYFCACLAAGEAYKRILKLRQGRGEFIDELAIDLFSLKIARDWDDLPATTVDIGALPALYVAGAGAVGQAAIATIATAGLIDVRMTVVDHDVVDEERTNLNRCVLTYDRHANGPKTAAVRESLASLPVAVRPIAAKWEAFITGSVPASDSAFESELEEARKYRVVLSCVDENGARHALQRSWPEIIYGGSTNSFAAKVAAYDMSSDGECLVCFNPLKPAISIESAAERFKGLSALDQQMLAAELGLDIKRMQEYVANPKCGAPAEDDLRKFATAAKTSEASVGFVSVAAGVLLAARMLRDCAEKRVDAPERVINYNFLRPASMRQPFHRRNPACTCGSSRTTRYDRLWRRSD